MDSTSYAETSVSFILAVYLLIYFDESKNITRLPLWSSGQFLATDREVPGSIIGAEMQWVLNGVHSTSC
jgi:hypothetical protein